MKTKGGRELKRVKKKKGKKIKWEGKRIFLKNKRGILN